MPKSREGFVAHYPLGLPPPFQKASPSSGIDRPVSDLQPMTPGEHTSFLFRRCGMRTCWFPSGYALSRLSLAIDQNSLARFSERTIEHRSTPAMGLQPLHALSVCNHLVSGSFHLPSRILFSFHSRY